MLSKVTIFAAKGENRLKYGAALGDCERGGNALSRNDKSGFLGRLGNYLYSCLVLEK